jgi:hypothetical protein
MSKYTGPLDRTHYQFLWHDLDVSIIAHYVIMDPASQEYTTLCGMELTKGNILKTASHPMCPTCREIELAEIAKYQATLPAPKISLPKPPEYYRGSGHVTKPLQENDNN